jgi:hypothetical protein
MTFSFVFQTGISQEWFAVKTLRAISLGIKPADDCCHGLESKAKSQQPRTNARYNYTFSIANKKLREQLQP